MHNTGQVFSTSCNTDNGNSGTMCISMKSESFSFLLVNTKTSSFQAQEKECQVEGEQGACRRWNTEL